MKKFLLAMVLSMILTGCHTMHFTQNGQIGSYTEEKTEKYHHQLIYELIELSQPVDVNEYCSDNNWQSVKTERSFVNGLIGMLGGAIYQQTSAAVACK